MGRGRGKGKRLAVTNHDDPGSDDDSENAKAGISTKEMKSSPVAENGKKRKRYSQVKEKSDSVNEENGVGTRSSTDDSTKSNGFGIMEA
ncbi:hypothetical protein FNV43_RR09875 [Rhamnella rubrinervis]|uniref:Uncharacterized protein n=1 Tax=Rhamnella rubrinervis TaxID=2594499 RepID=A0A8K0HAS0_9ROSA|nr:hypothetical protein FNV43_RR09875 [Rhamnella rubrinervis]